MNKTPTRPFSYRVFLLLVASAACSSSDAARPESAVADAATDEIEAPNRDAAFPQDRVARIDIKISPANWQIMMDDMTTLLGKFGEGMGRSPGGGGPAGRS